MSFVKFMNGPAGRVVRVLAGLALIIAGLTSGGTAGVVLAAVGLVPLTAGAFGVCLFAPLMRVSARQR